MCDFHSVIITADGRIWHNPSNSHSGIAREFGLENGVNKQEFWEVENDGQGKELPLPLVVARGYKPGGDVVPSLVERVAVRHYEKLQSILRGETDPATCAPFDGPNYSDVQAKYDDLMALKQVAPIIAAIEAIDGCTNEALIRILIDELGADVEEIAAAEIESAREDGSEANRESHYDDGYQAGIEAASDDLYTQEYMDEQIAEAVKEAEDNLRPEVYAEGYAAGFAKVVADGSPKVEFISGIPAFLFTK